MTLRSAAPEIAHVLGVSKTTAQKRQFPEGLVSPLHLGDGSLDSGEFVIRDFRK
jgi:hypothetical protein